MLVKYVKRFSGGLIPNTTIGMKSVAVLKMFSMTEYTKISNQM